MHACVRARMKSPSWKEKKHQSESVTKKLIGTIFRQRSLILMTDNVSVLFFNLSVIQRIEYFFLESAELWCD